MTIEQVVRHARILPRVHGGWLVFRRRVSAGVKETAALFHPSRLNARRKFGLLRKEVIQPHLPIRLPCYDFIPLTSHSFGTFVPYGFEQRLREQPTRVM